MNVFTQCRFFPVPRELAESGLLSRLPPSALRLYLLLLYFAQKHSAVQIETAWVEIGDYTGLDSKSVKIARESLVRANLVTCGRGQHGIITYQLLNPETGVPLPPPQGRRGLRKYCAKPGHSARTTRQVRREVKLRKSEEPSAYPLPWDEIGRDDRGEPGEE
jgi:hypothetical protein